MNKVKLIFQRAKGGLFLTLKNSMKLVQEGKVYAEQKNLLR